MSDTRPEDEFRELAEELTRHRHPADPRVILTDRAQLFEAVTKIPDYQAAILQRTPWGRSMTDLRQAFSQLIEKRLSETDLNLDAIGWKKVDNTIVLDFPPPLSLNVLKPIRDEFRSMANTYYRMSGISDLKVFLVPQLYLKSHDHAYPVLNCNWLTRGGSIWNNTAGEPQQVQEGDWLYQKPFFQHLSPPEGKDIRLTVAVIPSRVADLRPSR